MHPPVHPRTFAPALEIAYRALRRSTRWSTDDPEDVLDSGRRHIFACRHGQLLGALWAMEGRSLSVLVSRSGDGDLLAAILRRRAFGVIRGSTTNAGFPAARAALRTLRQGRSLGLAVDGPRGPWGQVHPGILRLAAAGGATLVPLTVSGADPWRTLGSWDRFEIPRPFAEMVVSVGAPIAVSRGAGGLADAGRRLALALGGSWVAPDSVSPATAQPSYGHP